MRREGGRGGGRGKKERGGGREEGRKRGREGGRGRGREKEGEREGEKILAEFHVGWGYKYLLLVMKVLIFQFSLTNNHARSVRDVPVVPGSKQLLHALQLVVGIVCKCLF